LQAASPDQVLLCIDPLLLGVAASLWWDGIELYGDLRVAAVERVDPLPIRPKGPGGLPRDLAGVYLGQRLRDRAFTAATVPDEQTADRFIIQTIRAARRDSRLPLIDTVDVICDMATRNAYDPITKRAKLEVSTILGENWGVARDEPPIYRCLTGLVATLGLMELRPHLKRDCRCRDEQIRALAVEALAGLDAD
jgi:hypothetical protein